MPQRRSTLNHCHILNLFRIRYRTNQSHTHCNSGTREIYCDVLPQKAEVPVRLLSLSVNNGLWLSGIVSTVILTSENDLPIGVCGNGRPHKSVDTGDSQLIAVVDIVKTQFDAGVNLLHTGY